MLEALETRIAPAAVVTFTDIDGDIVKITASRGPLDASDLSFIGGGSQGQLATLTLTDPGFSGANITFAVTRKPGGDGLAHVPHINAANVDLGVVTVKGDLGAITAGEPGNNILGIKALYAKSMRVIPTFDPTDTPTSRVAEGIGTLQIAGDFAANLSVTGSSGVIRIGGDLLGGEGVSNRGHLRFEAAREIRVGGDVIGGQGTLTGHISANEVGTLFVGGSVLGGSDSLSGAIIILESLKSGVIGGSIVGGTSSITGLFLASSSATIGSLVVKGDLVGGSGSQSGAIQLFPATVKNLTIHGSIVGGSTSNAGSVLIGAADTVKVGGSLIGGSSSFTGSLRISGSVQSVSIGGSLVGGNSTASESAQSSGYLRIDGPAKTVTVRGNLIGGSASGSDLHVDSSGAIQCLERLGSLTIGGSIIGGSETSSGASRFTSGYVSADSFGTVKIARGITGHPTTFTGIEALGVNAPIVNGTKLAIGSLTIGGDVRFAAIAAGFEQRLQVPSVGDAGIGSISIAGDFIASVITAGVRDGGNDGFGRNDAVITGQNEAELSARISTIVIRGHVIGTAVPGFDHFGIVAEAFGKVTINGAAVAPELNLGTLLNVLTGDIRLLQVSVN